MGTTSSAHGRHILLGVVSALAAVAAASTGCRSSSDLKTTHGPPPIPGPDSNTVVVIAPAPTGSGRINRHELDSRMAQIASTRELKVPKPGAKGYKAIRDEALGELITAVWLEGEAADRGIEVDSEEVAEALRKSGEAQYLREAGYSRAAMLERAKTQLFVNRIEDLLKEPGQPSQAIAEFDRTFGPKWRARTSCAMGFVVHQCVNFRAPGISESLPPPP